MNRQDVLKMVILCLCIWGMTACAGSEDEPFVKQLLLDSREFYPKTDYTLSQDGQTLISWDKDAKVLDLKEDPTFDKVRIIGENAFNKEICPSLDTIILPSSVKIIKDRAFEGHTRLHAVVFPSDLESIGVRAFAGCSQIKEVNLPNSVMEIKNSAFCMPYSSLEKFNIPISLEVLEPNVFEGHNMKHVVIPSTVRYIGADAVTPSQSACKHAIVEINPHRFLEFDYSPFGWFKGGACHFSKVIINSETPPTSGNMLVHEYEHSTLAIYVPDDAVDTYKNAHNWNLLDIHAISELEED